MKKERKPGTPANYGCNYTPAGWAFGERDGIYKPSHYTEGLPAEAIEIIEAVVSGDSGLSEKQRFLVGNALKYLLRAGKKGNPDEDLLKAANYCHRAATGEWAKKEA